MKYIKMFEENRSYWILPLDDRLGGAIKKIGAPKHFSLPLTLNKRYNYKYKYIFVYVNNDKLDWDWYWYWWTPELNLQKYCDIKGYSYLGPVDIPDYEFDANKYNL